MPKLSDTGLVILIFATIVIIISFFFFSILVPWVFIFLQIFGWILFVLSLIIGIITRHQYHVIHLKSGFPLKLDHLFFLICALTLSISLLCFVDILNFVYAGKLTLFALTWAISVIGIAFTLYILKKQKEKKKKNS